MSWIDITAESETATIKIDGVIGGDWFYEGVTSEQVEKDLEAITAIQSKKINVKLNSLGGSVLHGVRIHDILAQHPAEITIDINGYCASIATIIAMAGDNINISKNVQFLIHEARGGAYGCVDSIRLAADFFETVNNQMADIYAEKTGQKKEWILAQMAIDGGEGAWWTAEKAKEYGFVSNVYKPSKDVKAVVDSNTLAKYNIKAQLNQTNMDFKEAITELKAFIKDTFEGQKKDTTNVDTLKADVELRVAAMAENVTSLEAEKQTAVEALAAQTLLTNTLTLKVAALEVDLLKAKAIAKDGGNNEDGNEDPTRSKASDVLSAEVSKFKNLLTVK